MADSKRKNRIRDFSGYEISQTGVVTYLGDEVESYMGSDGTPWIRIEYGNYMYHGPVSGLMLDAWYDGNTWLVQFAYRDGDPWNLDLDNMRPVYRDKEGYARPVKFLVTPAGRRRIDYRMGKKVRIIETGEVYNSVREAADAIGGDKSNIYACLRGRLMSHKGFTFESLDSDPV